MLLSEHGLDSLWSVSSTSLNPCHEEIGLFWKHMKLPPRSWVSVRVQITQSLHFLIFILKCGSEGSLVSAFSLWLKCLLCYPVPMIFDSII